MHFEKENLHRRCVGIVKALAPFVSPKVYRKLILHVQVDPIIYPAHPISVHGVDEHLNILNSLLNVGEMLSEDFRDVQRQYDESAGKDLNTVKANFEFKLDIYKSYAEVLCQFGVACSEDRSHGPTGAKERVGRIVKALKGWLGLGS